MLDKAETEEVLKADKVEIKEIFKADTISIRQIPLNTYLFAFIRKRNLRMHHVPGLRAFAKNRKVATKEEWDKIFSEY